VLIIALATVDEVVSLAFTECALLERLEKHEPLDQQIVSITSLSSDGSVDLFIMRFEVGFEKTERIDPDAAALTKGRSLLGFSDRNLLEHRCNEHPHGCLLRWFVVRRQEQRQCQ
jgi:hypothetical protein